ncbi:hypothetical protein PVAP13_2KG571977 [Panicum virgatum]|uniref:Uncharacterized protein n=1 Tax=Panicum virgatum TaxID=38727 RepID=A0A8T0WF96_PANVG|nr:hypothetical protein PVAP13_2KG571977 [Panicum virgatum]
MSAHVCISARKAVTMASQLVESASLTTGTTPSVISKDTIHITLGTYVDVFVHTAEDTCNRKVCDETVVPFLDALRGLASISHILLEAALEELSHTHPRESLSEYALNCDVKAMQREYDWQMSDLEAAIRNAPPSKGCELVLPTIAKGVKVTESFLGLMVARRQRALGRASNMAA